MSIKKRLTFKIKNPEFKLVENLKTSFRNKVKKENYGKIGNLFKYIGIDESVYLNHIKNSEYWNDYCNNIGIQVDHIIPISRFNFSNPDEIKKCYDPKNLRLTTEKENSTKRNKLDLTLIQKYNISHLLPENYSSE